MQQRVKAKGTKNTGLYEFMENPIRNKDLKRRIIEISYKKKLSHIGSCLTAVDIIDEIYALKKPHEKFVLSSGHAGLALYVVLEKYSTQYLLSAGDYTTRNAEEIFDHHGVHPDRCISCGIDCSAGSLGHGLPIAVGMALADRSKNVYCLISDGEIAEGSIYEALNTWSDNELDNLKIYINDNGFSAYRETPKSIFESMMWYEPYVQHRETNVDDFPFLKGQIGHYKVMNEKEYTQALEVIG